MPWAPELMLLGSNVQFKFCCEITFESHGKREEENETGIGSLASPREIPGSVLCLLDTVLRRRAS